MPLPYTYDGPLPDGTRVTPLRVVAADGVESGALLYEPPAATLLVAFAHPRVEFSRHYLVPALVRAGFAVLGHDLRSLHNDVDATAGKLHKDLAAGLALARARYGTIVLAGNSGGGALYAGYQAHARAQGLPAGDGLVVFAAHPGEGRWLLSTIDPAVTDEGDPLSVDPALDMFAPANGYDAATGAARYAPDFLARYRAAQRARVARLDEAARAQVELERAARAAGDLRRSLPHRLMVIYRTCANPAYLDLTIDPSDRTVGTIFGGRPEMGNHIWLGVSRVLTPRAWLATWSGLSSRADFITAAAKLDVPTLFVPASGDSEVLPADADAMWAAIAAPDRTRHDLAGADHYLRPTPRRTQPEYPREELARVMTDWMRARFAAGG